MVSKQDIKSGQKADIYVGPVGEIEDKVKELLRGLVNTKVCVSLSSLAFIRAGFHSQICVVGTLEQHPTMTDHYRVMVNEHMFAYFDTSNIMGLSGVDIKDPVIHICIEQLTDPLALASVLVDPVDD